MHKTQNKTLLILLLILLKWAILGRNSFPSKLARRSAGCHAQDGICQCWVTTSHRLSQIVTVISSWTADTVDICRLNTDCRMTFRLCWGEHRAFWVPWYCQRLLPARLGLRMSQMQLPLTAIAMSRWPLASKLWQMLPMRANLQQRQVLQVDETPICANIGVARECAMIWHVLATCVCVCICC